MNEIKFQEILERTKEIELSIEACDKKMKELKKEYQYFKEELNNKNYLKNKRFTNMEMVFVQGGVYTPSFFTNEVQIIDLEVCKYQTTQDIYEKLMGNNISKWKEEKRPIGMLSWWEALEFCNRLSIAEGLEPVYIINGNNLKINQLGLEPTNPDKADFKKTEGYRLPTEVEWEWFARGGRVGTFNSKYAGSNNLEEVAWYMKNSGKKTCVVGEKNPNELGIYDCSGNIWEWCYDVGDKEETLQTISYIYNENIETRRLKGGSCYTYSGCCEISYRSEYEATRRDVDCGFRVVRTV